MAPKTEVRDGREFTVTTLRSDWRLSPSATKKRATGAGKMKPCASCQRRVIRWKTHLRTKGKAICGECRRRRKEGAAPKKL